MRHPLAVPEELRRKMRAHPGVKWSEVVRRALARAVRFQPGALRDDVVIPLYDLPALLAGAREEPSGVESAMSRAS